MSSEAHGAIDRIRVGDRSTGVRSVRGKEHEATGQALVPASRHPLPWRNEPSDGENHVTDANGLPVYDGADAAEMFRLYSDEEQAELAESPTGRRPGIAIRRVRRRRRPV